MMRPASAAPAVARSCLEISAALGPQTARLSPLRRYAPTVFKAVSHPSITRNYAQVPYRGAATASKPAAQATTAPKAAPATSTKPPVASTPPRANGNLSDGLADAPLNLDEGSDTSHDWTRSFHGLSSQPFSKEAADILLAPIPVEDVEIKPDGIIYLPEIKYRRILNKAFGPGGWGLAPRGESIVTPKSVTREYALVAHGRLVSIARGEQDYFSPEGIPTATEGCKSNAMMRCCKDLGVASELWDPRFIRKFKADHTRQAFVDHAVSKKRGAVWVRKGDPIPYPWKETSGAKQQI